MEVLLAVSLSAFFMLGVFSITNMWVQNIRAEQMAVHLQQVEKAADSFLRNTAIGELDNLANNSGGQLSNVQDFLNFLPGTNYTGSNMLQAANNPTGRDINVTLRTNNSTPGLRLYEIYIDTFGESMDGSLALSTARNIGARGGVIGRIYSNATEARSVYGTWRSGPNGVNIAGFTSSTGNFTPGNGHVAIYLAYADRELVGPYLYRSPIPGCTDCNKMSVALNMDGNDINDIDTFTANTVETDAATVSTLTAERSANFNGQTTLNDTTTVTDSLNANTVEAGTITADGTLTASEASFENINANDIRTGSINTTSMELTNIHVRSAQLSASDASTITATEASFGTINSNNMYIEGSLSAEKMYVNHNLNIEGALHIMNPEGSITAPIIQTNDLQVISGP